MDRKLITICVLTISAIALMIANFVTPPARAEVSVNSHDYQAVTASMQGGGEGLYILDNRTGQIVVLSYDPNTRSLVPRASRQVADAFR
ncbi:MAG TPA: hypothetical protein VHX86_04870 [Tepidisphaeraceae bacterium]|jgi:hypothetical protein|nr:hypothetical protein [Tepidisphaeraceae bacterium]